MFAVSPIDNCPHLTEVLRAEGYQVDLDVRDKPCVECKDCSENWLCLKCNQMYCSRYVKGHFLQHHENNAGHDIGISMADLSTWGFPLGSFNVDPRLRDVLGNLRSKQKNVTPREIDTQQSVTKAPSVPLPFENETVWSNVVSVLSQKITSVESLTSIITQQLKARGFRTSNDYGALVEAISTTDSFFDTTLPFIQALVLKTPTLFVDGVPLLSDEGKVTLSKEQCACILANAFFCTFDRSSNESDWDRTNLPSINFDDMYGSRTNHGPKVAKLQMIINYFNRLVDSIPAGKVTFERQVLKVAPTYESLDTTLVSVTVKNTGSIEDSHDALQADFANAFIGGGSISYGCVQEEIRFSLCPECNVSRLFCPKMNDKEAIIIKGAEQYSSYTGYAFNLKYGGNYVDTNVDPVTGENQSYLVAMDALIFSHNQRSQWRKDKIDRELNKAYVAFYKSDRSISTGNWGCGAFAGDKQLKFIIQWLAASVAGTSIIYYTFGEDVLANEITEFCNKMATNGVTVGSLYQALLKVNQLHASVSELPKTFAVVQDLLHK